ncbi:pyridoxamine 5'-phosphate oxidase-related FMN-binding protein [Chondrocystis sp. NIES-4102]|nr:pyridoxamine 5'-phosphate oxidase-related FMN-binding protein [Chondrocystis sp. NIES-4102]
MVLAPWRSLLTAALHRNRSDAHARYFQLATVTPEGYPANRTVVFRGFLDEQHNTLKIITDLRSQKVQDLQYQPNAEVCWYFTKTREQFRIRGKLQLVTNEETDRDLQLARQTTWQNISDAARDQFTWLDPGKPLLDNPASASDPDPQTPLANFALLLLIPYQVDHLQLRGEKQQRCFYKLQTADEWIIEPINP